MMVRKIVYKQSFIKQFEHLPAIIQQQAVKKEALFKANPLHPGLRLHQLHGRLQGGWSISVARDYRIIFEREDDGVIVFVSIGRHAIYGR